MRSFPHDVQNTSRHRGFSLVEVTLAIGIFSFALVGVVGLLASALQSSSETQRDSALASAVGTANVVIRSSDPTISSLTLHFDRAGNLLPGPADAYFLFQLQSDGSSAGFPNLEFWSARVTAPYPQTGAYEGNFVFSRLIQ